MQNSSNAEEMCLANTGRLEIAIIRWE